MKATPLAGPFGAEITGLDLSEELSFSVLKQLIDWLYEYRVVVIRAQDLKPAEYVRFGKHWGDPIEFFLPTHRDAEHPEMIRISNSPETPMSQRDGAAHWHTDSSYETVPASVTMLYAVEAPDVGGDTMFIDMAAAFDGLPADQQAEFESLQARHMVVGGKSLQLDNEKVGGEETEEVRRQREKESPLHPLVLRHPVTGRAALYAVSGSAYGIEGQSPEEGTKLLAELKAHAVQEQFMQRVKAGKGDVLIWDNLSTMHSATPSEYSDEPGKRRLLYRISTRNLPQVYR